MLTYQIRLFFTAICFFTRLPFMQWAGNTLDDLTHSVRFFPLVGFVIGSFTALIFWLSQYVLPPPLAILISMTTSLLLTGAFHEDGLADTIDGLGGGLSLHQKLEIMKDSRIGSYGTIALVMALVIKFESLSNISPDLIPITLIVGHTLSRFGSTLLIASQDYIRESGKAKPLASQITSSELIIATSTGLAPLMAFPFPALWTALLFPAIGWLYFSNQLKKSLGGYTGDCLGAMQQITEILFYLGIVACS